MLLTGATPARQQGDLRIHDVNRGDV